MKYIFLIFSVFLSGCTVIAGAGLGAVLGVGGVALKDSDRIATLPKEEDKGFFAEAVIERLGEKVSLPLMWQCQQKLSFSLGLGQWQRSWEPTEDVIAKEFSSTATYFYQIPYSCEMSPDVPMSVDVYWIDDSKNIAHISVQAGKIQNIRQVPANQAAYAPNAVEKRIQSFVKSQRQRYVSIMQRNFGSKIWRESPEMAAYLEPLTTLTVSPARLINGKPSGFLDFPSKS